MENPELYYRRSYNALNKLIQVYKDGYTERDMLNFRKQLINQMLSRPKVAKEEQASLIFTAITALLGLNKESMEHTGKFLEYRKNYNTINARNIPVSEDTKSRLDEFDTQKVISTDFDEWLSITTKIDADKDSKDHLRRVRNGILHGNFYLDFSCNDFTFTHIKTKSYYESEILNDEFQMFVFEYFSNLEQLGLTEKIHTYTLPTVKINTKEDLIRVLFCTTINAINYDGLTTLENDTPELLLKESTSKDCIIDVETFDKKLSESNNHQNMNVTSSKLSNIDIFNIFNFIDTKYGDNFYKLDLNEQASIITTYLQYKINPKREVSNWIMHFWYLYTTLFNGKFHQEFFDGDEYGKESCYPTLLILKAYLIMYRLQYKDFEEIDYSKIDFDVRNLKVQLKSRDKTNPTSTVNYFKESFDKEKSKGLLADDKDIWNKVVCEVLRNSLAHGNIKPFIDQFTLEPCIEMYDVDPKKGNIRTIVMTLDIFEKLLNSEAFLPRYCLKKEEIVTRTLTK